jgi:serine/threonine protein kinase
MSPCSDWSYAVSPLASYRDFHKQYVLGAKLGLGHFGQVHVATEREHTPKPWQIDDGALADGVAAKIVHLSSKKKPEKLSRKMQKVVDNEITAWRSIGKHPHCVELIEVFYGNSFCYMVMERCMQGFLQALECMPVLDERCLGRVFAQALDGIAHCHRVDVIHRDIKPDNFLFGGKDGQVVKLCDFGLSIFVPEEGKKVHVCGTPPFMCPEMLAGKGYDTKADVWSFGVVVYTLMFGKFPYHAPDSCEMKRVILAGDVEPDFIPSDAKGEDADWRSDQAMSLVRALLTRNPDERPSTEDVLSMPWIAAATEDCHLPGTELPCLKGMLANAKGAGSFELRDTQAKTKTDILMKNLQKQAQRQLDKFKAKSSLISWESNSDVSTDYTSVVPSSSYDVEASSVIGSDRSVSVSRGTISMEYAGHVEQPHRSQKCVRWHNVEVISSSSLPCGKFQL